MKILFTGDSITEGDLGWNYVDSIDQRCSDIFAINMGLGGDTLRGISDRTIKHLEQCNDYDIIVIAAGHNDVILPKFKTMGIIHKTIAYSLKRRGSIPIDNPVEFKRFYLSLISKIKEICDAKVILTTLSSLNEAPDSGTNQTRIVYNMVIKEITNETDAYLADVGKEFDDYLSCVGTRSYFMDSLIDTSFKDKHKTQTVDETDALSNKRKLHLTIDGVHINSKGAKIYTEVICKTIDEILLSS